MVFINMAPSADARAAFSQNQISRRTPASPRRESVALAHGLGEIRRRHFTELVFLDPCRWLSGKTFHHSHIARNFIPRDLAAAIVAHILGSDVRTLLGD